MTLRHHDQEALRKSGYELTYTLRPLLDLHSKAGEVKNMVMMLGIAGLCPFVHGYHELYSHYHSSIVNRTKEVAVHKSYGASETNIHSMVCRNAGTYGLFDHGDVFS